MPQIDNGTAYPILATPVGSDIVLGYRPAGADPMNRMTLDKLSIDTVNGQSLKSLTTGLIKNTTATGVPVIANPGVDYATPSQIVGTKNRIINGYPFIDQRNVGAAQTITAAAALAYTVDRWYAYCTGANITGQQVQVNGLYRYKFTGAASNTAVGFGQRIEARNCADLAGTTATLQVKLSSSSLTSITWTAYYANTTDTFGTLASPTRTSTGTGTFTITSTETTYSAQIAVSASATTGIEIVFTGGALLGTQTLTIGDVQLEAGSGLLPFERRSYGAELALCQRYLPVLPIGGPLLGLSATTTVAYIPHVFPVPPRVAPTGLSSLGAISATYSNGSGTPISATLSISAAFTGGVSLSAVVASGLTVGQAGFCTWSTYPILLTGCEL